MKPRYFAVSLVYYKIKEGEPHWLTDEEGMLIGMRPNLTFEVGCTTGCAMAATAGDAITMVRSKGDEGKFQGWIEQVTQAHEFPLGGWWPWTLSYARYWIRRFMRRLGLPF